MGLQSENIASLPGKVAEIGEKYPHLYPTLFFLGGIVFDFFTLGHLDEWGNLFSQIFYFALIFFLIPRELGFFSANQAQGFRKKFVELIDKYHLEIFHFSLGALLSAYTFFYLKSADFSSSFIFLSIFVAILVLNEVSWVQQKGLIIRSAASMLCLYSFCLAMTPVFLGQSGHWVFALANVIYFLILAGTGRFFIKKAPALRSRILKEILAPGLAVLLLMVILYFSRAIPPIPLSVSHIGIYHGVEKNYPTYRLKLQNPWWKFWNHGDENFVAADKDKVYAFFRIFAPGGYEDKIHVRWMQKIDGQWKTSDKIPITIEGGRREGYRGYTYKSNYRPGEWKVRIETPGEFVISSLTFEITKRDTKDKREFRYITDE